MSMDDPRMDLPPASKSGNETKEEHYDKKVEIAKAEVTEYDKKEGAWIERCQGERKTLQGFRDQLRNEATTQTKYKPLAI